MTESLHQQEARQGKLLRQLTHKFIAHKKRIFNNSKFNEPLHIAEFTAAIDVLNREIANAADYSNGGYANMILRNIECFKKLLPHHKNVSYEGSLDCLDILIGVCIYLKKTNDAQ